MFYDAIRVVGANGKIITTLRLSEQFHCPLVALDYSTTDHNDFRREGCHCFNYTMGGVRKKEGFERI